MTDVFVSYSRADQPFVRRLHEALAQRGRDAWVDWDDIRPTEEFMPAIFKAIESANTFVFVLTPTSIASRICTLELAHAAKHNKRMVPLVTGDVDAAAVPEALAKLNWIVCRAANELERSVDTLISALDTDLDWTRSHTRVLGRAIEWETHGRNDSFVLRGVDLQDAERWLSDAGADKERQPTGLQTDYILCSRRVTVRRQRVLLASVSMALVVAIALAGAAFFARQEAVRQEAQARLTSVQADFDLGVQYRRSEVIDPRTLAHLARALRTSPAARLPRMYLTSLLRTASWGLPQTEPLRHDGIVVAARFSPDGSRIVTASADRTVRVWNAETGDPLTPPIPHTVSLTTAAFSPDGRTIVTASEFGGTAQTWDAATGRATREPLFPAGEAVVAAEFSPDGRRLVTAAFHAQVWDVASGQPVGQALRHDDALRTASFSPDGRRVLTAGSDWKARVWDAETGNPLIEPVRHEGDVTCAAFASDGRWIVTGSRDKTARVWDAATGTPVTQPLVHAGDVVAASFSGDGLHVVTGSTDGYARVWNVSRSALHGAPMQHAGTVADVHFSPDNRWVVTASHDGTARIWDADTGAPLAQPLRHERAVLRAAFRSDGRRIVTASQDHTARVWNTMASASVPTVIDHKAPIRAASFSFDRSRVVTTAQNDTAQLWNTDNGHPIHEPFQHVFWVKPSMFSADGRWVLAVLNDGSVGIWDATTGNMDRQPLRGTDTLLTADFSPDGQTIATASEGAVQLWDFASRSMTVALPLQGFKDSLRFSADGRRLIAHIRNAGISVWDVHQRRRISEVTPLQNQGPLAAESSADGLWIVAPLWDFSARLRDAHSGKVVGQPMQHDAQIQVVAFSADSRRIVTGSYDGTAQVWDTQTASPVGGRLRHAGTVRAAAFNLDGTLLVTGGDDGIARVWDTERGTPAGEPMRHNGAVDQVSFSHDGARVLTVAGTSARIWDVVVDTHATLPDWLPQLAEALGGRRLNESGVLVPPQKSVIELKRDVLALRGMDFWSRLGRWFFTAGLRPSSPDSDAIVRSPGAH